MPKLSVVTLVVAFLIASACAYGADPYKLDVQIVNKAKLPPKRLADAIYAKAILTENPKLLKESVRLDPTDPIYMYMRIPVGIEDPSEVAKFRAKVIEQTLAVSPHYLPALYDAAIMKPSIEGQLKALEDIAAIDKDNAKPFYLMATLLYTHLTKEKMIIPNSDGLAMPLSEDDWTRILGLIGQGNARRAFNAVDPRVPSSEDIRVFSNKKAWPSAAVESTMILFSNYAFDRGMAAAPTEFIGLAMFRQLARQARWHSKELNRRSEKAKAIDDQAIIHAFADKLAASEPYRMSSLQSGASMHKIAWVTEQEILTSEEDKPHLEAIKSKSVPWENIKPGFDFDRFTIVLRGVEVERGEFLKYLDYQCEAACVMENLKKLGLK